MEPWRACRPVVADLYHFDVEQDPDPIKVKIWIRILITVMRIRTTLNNVFS
jgi:hypothetical protein